jgi:bifunctional UDP-N-acetylglucosamine pyrophosphorylase/glucosamine-1-phosphate N-acetyltransferase
VKAVILAAGKGTRLQPLTSTRPKHMIPLGGSPLLEHLLIALKESDVKDILIVTGYRETQVRTYFSDGAQWELNIEYSHQEKLLGSGHAIGLAKDYVGNDDFLAVYGDLVVDPSIIRSILRKHDQGGFPVLCVVPVTNPQQYGIVLLKDDRVIDIIEKPTSNDVGNLANAGIYIFPPEVFTEIQRTPESPRGEIEITDTIKQMIRQNIEYTSNRIRPTDWMDVGRPWDLLEANRRVLERCSPVILGDVEEGVYLNGRVHVEAGAKLRSGTYVEGPVFIGSGSDVGPNCYLRPFTSLERNVRIGNGCEVKNSLILDGTHIGHLSYVADSIVGANCNFGAGSTIANLRLDKANVRVRIKGEAMDSGRRKLGVIMGDDVEIGIGAKLMPGVKIGTSAWIGPNTTVYEDVPPETFVMQKQEIIHGHRKRL